MTKSNIAGTRRGGCTGSGGGAIPVDKELCLGLRLEEG